MVKLGKAEFKKRLEEIRQKRDFVAKIKIELNRESVAVEVVRNIKVKFM